MTNNWVDIKNANLVLIMGGNAAEAHPCGFKWVTPGSVFALVIWILASAAFACYVANFGSYNKTYGSLATVVVVLIWFWITNLAILFGHELNAERERGAEFEEGTPRAEREIQLEPRDTPKRQKTT